MILSLAGFVCAAEVQHSELAEIQKAIKESGADWTAGMTSMAKLGKEEFKTRLGAVVPFEMQKKPGDIIHHESESKDLTPSNYDWRNYNGMDWTTPIKDQAQCGSCTAFGSLAAFESLWKIHNNAPLMEIDLSEQHLFMCSGGGCSTGATLQSPAMYIVNNGVPDEACFPYTATDQPCSNTCPDWQERAIQAGSWRQLFGGESAVKEAVAEAPVLTSFTVYEDFRYYEGGVYEHVSGGMLGGHAVCIVGWNDSENSWIVKNSWGTEWGEEGWFRIKRGDCGIGMNTIAFSMEPGGCMANETAKDTDVWSQLEVLRTFRDEFLADSDMGRNLITLYEAFSPEIAWRCSLNDYTRYSVLKAVEAAASIAQNYLETGEVQFSKQEVKVIQAAADHLKGNASPPLRFFINIVQGYLHDLYSPKPIKAVQ